MARKKAAEAQPVEADVEAPAVPEFEPEPNDSGDIISAAFAEAMAAAEALADQ